MVGLVLTCYKSHCAHLAFGRISFFSLNTLTQNYEKFSSPFFHAVDNDAVITEPGAHRFSDSCPFLV